jgi:BspA type Leucine rich repeat region (6 copies)
VRLRYSAVLFAEIFLDGNPITNTNSMLAVFNGTNCAGVATISAGPVGMLFQLPVYANQTVVSGMSYQFYDGTTGLISTLNETYSFTNGAISGSIVSPVTLHVTSSEIWSNGFAYTTNGNSASIVGYSGTNSTVNVPSLIGGVPVTSLANNALANLNVITSVVIPNGVTTLGQSAFSGDSNLVSVTIPDSVVNFGANIFGNSPNVVVNGSPMMAGYLASNAASLGFTGTALASIQSEGGASSNYEWIEPWLLSDTNFLSGIFAQFQSTGLLAQNLSNTVLSVAGQFLPSNVPFVTEIASNTNFLTALVAAVTSSTSNYGILKQGASGPAGPQGAQGAAGVFDPSVLTNTAFLVGLANNQTFATSFLSNASFSAGFASNSVFLSALGNQIAILSNNLGLATKADVNTLSAQSAGLSNALSNTEVTVSGVSNALAASLASQGTSLSNAVSNAVAELNGASSALSALIASNSLSLSNVLSTSIAAQGASLSNALSNTEVTVSGVSNALSGTIASNAVIFSNALSGVSNTLSGSIASQVSGLSNVLSGVIATDAASNSNALSGVSNALAASLASQGTSLSNAVSNATTSLSNALNQTISALSAQTSPTNPAFIAAIAAQILAATNNDGIAVKQNQSLNFPAIPFQTLTPTSTVTLNVTSSANQTPVVYSIGNSAVATVSHNVLTLIGSGSTTITATQGGNSLYNPVSATQTLVVNKAAQTISFPSTPALTYAPNKTLTLKSTASSGLTNTYLIGNAAIGSIVNNVLVLIGTGTTTITATNPGNAYFLPASATQALIVK